MESLKLFQLQKVRIFRSFAQTKPITNGSSDLTISPVGICNVAKHKQLREQFWDNWAKWSIYDIMFGLLHEFLMYICTAEVRQSIHGAPVQSDQNCPGRESFPSLQPAVANRISDLSVLFCPWRS
jgi:hypothetical protein